MEEGGKTGNKMIYFSSLIKSQDFIYLEDSKTNFT